MSERRKIDPDELLTIQELADALKRSRRYVQSMRRLGFKMPGDRGTLAAALLWLEKHPWPTSSRWASRRP